MKTYKILNGAFIIVFCAISSWAIEYSDGDDTQSGFSKVCKPDDVFSGIYLGGGLGYDFLDNKYDIDVPTNVTLNSLRQKKGSINTHAYNLYGVFGFGGVYNRFWYTGVETELFVRRGGQTKHDKGVRIENKNAYGFNFRLRGGYIFTSIGLLTYIGAAAERSINHIAIKDNTNSYPHDKSYGSYHPSLSIGLEKKLRNNWSLRMDLCYTIGIWDDTDRFFIANNTKIPFKAKTNKKSVKVMICKYL